MGIKIDPIKSTACMACEMARGYHRDDAFALLSACPFCYAGLQVGIKAPDFPLVMKDLTCLVEEALIKKAG
jgi:hypothetical protein